MKFTEERLEQAIIQLLEEQGYPYAPGAAVDRAAKDEILIKDDLRTFLAAQYKAEGITEAEIESVIRQLETLPASLRRYPPVICTTVTNSSVNGCRMASCLKERQSGKIALHKAQSLRKTIHS